MKLKNKKGPVIMNLRLVIPNKSIFNDEAQKISATGTHGSFQILPGHIDCAISIKPGILTITTKKHTHEYYAVNRGFLVKEGEDVHISCFQAIKGDSLESLSITVEENFKKQNEEEKKINEILEKLERDTLEMFAEIK